MSCNGGSFALVHCHQERLLFAAARLPTGARMISDFKRPGRLAPSWHPVSGRGPTVGGVRSASSEARARRAGIPEGGKIGAFYAPLPESRLVPTEQCIAVIARRTRTAAEQERALSPLSIFTCLRSPAKVAASTSLSATPPLSARRVIDQPPDRDDQPIDGIPSEVARPRARVTRVRWPSRRSTEESSCSPRGNSGLAILVCASGFGGTLAPTRADRGQLRRVIVRGSRFRDFSPTQLTSTQSAIDIYARLVRRADRPGGLSRSRSRAPASLSKQLRGPRPTTGSQVRATCTGLSPRRRHEEVLVATHTVDSRALRDRCPHHRFAGRESHEPAGAQRSGAEASRNYSATVAGAVQLIHVGPRTPDDGTSWKKPRESSGSAPTVCRRHRLSVPRRRARRI